MHSVPAKTWMCHADLQHLQPRQSKSSKKSLMKSDMQTWTMTKRLLQTLSLPAVLLLQQVRCHACLKPASCTTRTVSGHSGPLSCCPYGLMHMQVLRHSNKIAIRL